MFTQKREITSNKVELLKVEPPQVSIDTVLQNLVSRDRGERVPKGRFATGILIAPTSEPGATEVIFVGGRNSRQIDFPGGKVEYKTDKYNEETIQREVMEELDVSEVRGRLYWRDEAIGVYVGLNTTKRYTGMWEMHVFMTKYVDETDAIDGVRINLPQYDGLDLYDIDEIEPEDVLKSFVKYGLQIYQEVIKQGYDWRFPEQAWLIALFTVFREIATEEQRLEWALLLNNFALVDLKNAEKVFLVDIADQTFGFYVPKPDSFVVSAYIPYFNVSSEPEETTNNFSNFATNLLSSLINKNQDTVSMMLGEFNPLKAYTYSAVPGIPYLGDQDIHSPEIPRNTGDNYSCTECYMSMLGKIALELDLQNIDLHFANTLKGLTYFWLELFKFFAGYGEKALLLKDAWEYFSGSKEYLYRNSKIVEHSKLPASIFEYENRLDAVRDLSDEELFDVLFIYLLGVASLMGNFYFDQVTSIPGAVIEQPQSVIPKEHILEFLTDNEGLILAIVDEFWRRLLKDDDFKDHFVSFVHSKVQTVFHISSEDEKYLRNFKELPPFLEIMSLVAYADYTEQDVYDVVSFLDELDLGYQESNYFEVRRQVICSIINGIQRFKTTQEERKQAIIELIDKLPFEVLADPEIFAMIQLARRGKNIECP